MASLQSEWYGRSRDLWCCLFNGVIVMKIETLGFGSGPRRAKLEERATRREWRPMALCAYISSGVNTMRTFALLNCTSLHPASKLQLGVSSRVEECSRMIWAVDSINSPPPRYRAPCVPGFCCIRWRSLIKKWLANSEESRIGCFEFRGCEREKYKK